MPDFAVVLSHGPTWDATREIREQAGWDEHGRFMDGLVADGFLLLGGPVGDRSTTLHAIHARDESEIIARFADDPWFRDGLLQIETIQPWSLWLDYRTVDTGADQ